MLVQRCLSKLGWQALSICVPDPKPSLDTRRCAVRDTVVVSSRTVRTKDGIQNEASKEPLGYETHWWPAPVVCLAQNKVPHLAKATGAALFVVHP